MTEGSGDQSGQVRLGLFGGSFDPIHNGHIAPVLEAKRLFNIDKVLYMPTAQPPHKRHRRFAPAMARYAMVEMALLNLPDLQVSTHELTLGRPAYTVETLEYFREQQPEADLHLIIGADSYNELDNWVRWQDILELARLVVLARPGWSEKRDDLPAALENPGPGRLFWLETHQVNQSSTRVRLQLQRGERPENVPGPVLDFCTKYQLY